MHSCNTTFFGGFGHDGAVGAVGDQQGHARIGGPLPCCAVAALAGVAQFQHVAQQGDLARVGQGFQHREGSFHAVRAGIVAILDKGDAALLHDMLAHAGGLVAGKRGGAPGGVQPQAGGGGVGGQGVVHGMQARGGDGHGKAAVGLIHQRKGRAFGAGVDIRGAYIGGLALDTEPYRAQAGGYAGGGQQVVVGVQGQGRTVRQACADLHFCFQYILAGA